MFYCEKCGRKNKWPLDDLLHPMSKGPCEICGKVAVCHDVPSSQLPVPPRKVPGKRQMERYESLLHERLKKFVGRRGSKELFAEIRKTAEETADEVFGK